MIDIYYHSRFIEDWRKLPIDMKIRAKNKIKIFRNDIRHPSLRNHKLSGELKDSWAFCITMDYRIIYKYKNASVVFARIGKHDDVY